MAGGLKIKNLVGLVTGGSSGLGKATASYLLEKGCKGIALFDLPTSKGELVSRNMGDRCIFIPGDVRKEEDVNKALDIIQDKFNHLNLLVNCAGISVSFKTYNFFKNQPHALEEFQNVMMVNTMGTFNVIRLAAGLMDKNSKDPKLIPGNQAPFANGTGADSTACHDNENGVIIMTSASAALDYNGQCGQVAFAASKAAIAGMTVPLARDFSNNGIRVCTIAPGLFKTPLVECLPEKVRSFLSSTVPFPPRLGDPMEYASLVHHIYQNSMLNGCVIRLDGGWRPIV